MLNPLDLIPKEVFTVLLLVAGITIGVQAWTSKSQRVVIAETKAQVAQLEAAIEKSNAKGAADSLALSNQLIEAKDAAKKREAKLAAQSRTLQSDLDGLRLTTQGARAAYRLNGNSENTRTLISDTGYDLFDQCVTRYTEVAKAADVCNSYVIEVEQAWPVLPLPAKSAESQ